MKVSVWLKRRKDLFRSRDFWHGVLGSGIRGGSAMGIPLGK